MVKFGAQLYTLREFTKTADDVAKTLEKVAKMGYPGVQVSGFGPVDPKDTAKALKDNGLECAATHVGWPRFLNELDAVIEEHLLWDCKHAAVGCLAEEYYSLDGLKKFLDELAGVAPKLLEAGIDFSYHNHNHEFIKYDGITWMERVYDLSNPQWLKAEIDTYWIQAGGADPAEWISRLADRQTIVHFKDMSIHPGREQRFTEVGEGNLNWKAICEAVKATDIEWILVEQDDCYGGDPFAALEVSYNNLQGMKSYLS